MNRINKNLKNSTAFGGDVGWEKWFSMARGAEDDSYRFAMS
jgi:hypothetical protein